MDQNQVEQTQQMHDQNGEGEQYDYNNQLQQQQQHMEGGAEHN